MKAKPVAALTAKDLARYPVWEYDIGHETLPGRDETWVVPVKSLPVTDLSNRVVSSSLRFRNGQILPGLLGCVSLQDALSTQQFLVLSIWHDSGWFHLARYFDYDFVERSPAALAGLLALPLEKVFPIAYNISGWARGLAEVVRGEVLAEPEIRLSDQERMDLIFGRYKKK
jgi:hypothetical protein